MTKKIKVLTLGDQPLFPSGVANQTRYMIEACLKSGKFQFISLGGAIKHEQYNPVKTREYGDDWVIFPVDGYGNADQIRSIIRLHRPDILWFMTDPRYWVWLWEIEDEIRPLMPMVYYHVWDNYPLPDYNEPYYSSCDFIATISKVTDDIVANVAPNIDKRYIPHAVDTDIFKKLDEEKVAAIKRDHLDAEDKFVIFWNNRNARRKQSGSLIFWFKAFLDKVGHDKAKLLMHTDPKDQHGQDLIAIIQNLGLTNGEVIFSTAKVGAMDLAMMYNVADCTINISDAEGFGLGTLESLACETPIIVNKTGGLQQQICDNEGNCFGVGLEPTSKAIIGSQQIPYIYEDRLSEETVVNGMLEMYNMSKEERDAVGAKAREFVMKDYNFDDFNNSWVETLEQIYEKHGSWENRKNHKSWELLEV